MASSWDALQSRQLSRDEVAAAVEEAHAFRKYAAAHAYTPEAITRAVSAWVRTLEHGNLMDERSARLRKRRRAYLVATLVTYVALRERGAQLGMNSDMLAKNEQVIEGGLRALQICKRAGVPVGFGSDLLGPLQSEQGREFLLRREVLSPIEIIRQATQVGAEIVRMSGRLGAGRPRAFADLLVLEGNPLRNLELLAGQGERLAIVMKADRLVKNRLATR